MKIVFDKIYKGRVKSINQYNSSWTHIFVFKNIKIKIANKYKLFICASLFKLLANKRIEILHINKYWTVWLWENVINN